MSLSRPSYVSPTTGSDHGVALARPRLDRGGDEGVADHPDAVRVGDRDRRRQEPGLADPLQAGHLAVAVEPVATGEDGFASVLGAARDDDRDAGPDRASPDHERAVAVDDRGVADAHARHVRDGIAGAGLPAPDDDPEVSRPHRRMLAAPLGPRSARYGNVPHRAHAPMARWRPPEGRAVSSPGDPRPTVQRTAPAPPAPGPDRGGARDRCRRGVPRPARARPARERPARPQRALDVPDRRSGRGPRVAGGRARSVRRGAAPRRAARSDARRPGGRAAVPRRARRLPRLRPRGEPGALAGDRAGRPGPAAAPSRAPRLGRRLGPADRPRVAGRTGPRWRRPAAGAPAGRRPRPARRTDPPARPSRAALGPIVFRSGLDRAAYEAGVERVRRAHRRRRHLPGEPHPPARGPVRRRAVGPLPPPADGRPVALLGLSRSRARPADRSPAGAPVGLARAVPVGRCRGGRQDRPDQGHATARP